MLVFGPGLVSMSPDKIKHKMHRLKFGRPWTWLAGGLDRAGGEKSREYMDG